jgi:hypothetical protein
MEKEVLEALLAALEAQKAEIAELRALVEAQGGDLGGLIEIAHRQHDQNEFDAFKERQGSKFDPVLDSLKALHGEDFDPVRNMYDMASEASTGEEYDENSFIDAALADTVEKLNVLKTALPEAALPAIEEAEQEVQEAALIAESTAEESPAAESVIEESVAEQTDANSDSPEDEDKMLQEAWEESSGRGYVSR